MRFIPELLTDVHYGPGRLADTPKGSRPFNYILALLALVILVIALLNYINLSTAKASERAKEVGVRKVNGAGRGQLIRQFLLESFLLVALAWIAALGLVALGLPIFDRLLNMKLPLTWKGMPWEAAGLLAATVLLSGLYPALRPVLLQARDRPQGVVENGGLWLHGKIHAAPVLCQCDIDHGDPDHP